MVKKIKAIKCPHCGCISKSKTAQDSYYCKQCDTEYFIENDDININVNHTYTNKNKNEEPKKVYSVWDVFQWFFGWMLIIFIGYTLYSCSRPSKPIKINITSEIKVTAPEIVKQIEAGGKAISEIKQSIDNRALNSSNINLGCYSYSPQGCNELFITRLSLLTGKNGLKLSVFNKKIWQLLIDSNSLTSLTSWLDLTPDKIMPIEGISHRRSKQILTQIELAKKQKFSFWLRGLEFDDIPEYVDQYNWQQISQWSVEEWQKKLAVSKSKAILYRELTQSANIKAIVDELRRHKINGF